MNDREGKSAELLRMIGELADRQRRIILGPVHLPRVRCTYTIFRDDDTNTPRIVFNLHGMEDGLTRETWDYIAEHIRGAWEALGIACTCGHDFWAHDASSPHACAHPGGACACKCFAPDMGRAGGSFAGWSALPLAVRREANKKEGA